MGNIPDILKYIKIYKFKSIFLKEFTAVLLAVLIPLSCLNLTLFFYSERGKTAERENYNGNVLSKAVNTFDAFMQTVDKISYSIIADQYVGLFMVYPNERLNNKDISSRTGIIQNKLSSFVMAGDLIDSIYLYSIQNDYIISDNTSNVAAEFSDNKWFYKYKSMDEAQSWIEVRRKTGDNEAKYYLSFFKMIKPYSENEGILAVNIDINKFGGMLANAGAEGNYEYYILEGETKILYTGDFGLLNQDYGAVPDSKDMETVSLRSDYNNWSYIYKYPKKSENNSLFIIFFSLILSVLAPVLIAYFISLRVFKPLILMLSEAENLHGFHFGSGRESQGAADDEFKYISGNLLSAFSSYQNAEKELESKLTLLKKSQTVALQSQINPHFLFNTLETINLKAAKYFKGENDISSMLNSLSKLLRLGIETQDHLTTIEKELEHARTFVEILSVRYADKLSVVWDIDESVLENKICKITLQPIIENAMYHGIKPMDKNGVITVKFTGFSDYIEITVADNGVGMPPEKTEELNARLKSGYIKEDLNIGVSNVNQRVRLIFGDAYGLSVTRNETGGITVKIIIPRI
jgi:two-component system sensor histidine kinase YesM